MNSHSNSHVSRAKRESMVNEAQKENTDYRSERQTYIAECKRLLSGLRGC
jgi:hypothetical protein